MLDNIEFNAYHSNEVYAPNSLEIRSDGKFLGYLGKLQKSVLRHFDIDKDVWAFELNYAAWFEQAGFKKTFKPISRFPSVQRDLALSVGQSVSAGLLMQAIRTNAGPHLDSLELFDLYTGDQIISDRKSLAFSMVFQSEERTLTEEEIDSTVKSIITAVEKEFGAKLR